VLEKYAWTEEASLPGYSQPTITTGSVPVRIARHCATAAQAGRAPTASKGHHRGWFDFVPAPGPRSSYRTDPAQHGRNSGFPLRASRPLLAKPTAIMVVSGAGFMQWRRSSEDKARLAQTCWPRAMGRRSRGDGAASQDFPRRRRRGNGIDSGQGGAKFRPLLTDGEVPRLWFLTNSTHAAPLRWLAFQDRLLQGASSGRSCGHPCRRSGRYRQVQTQSNSMKTR